ncbi:MAG: hypothetical protein ACPGVU_05030 [Limisphaerales bacterium]
MVLFFAAIGLITMAAALDHSSQSSVLTERRNQLSRSINAAEAATEKVVAQLQHDFKSDGERQVRRRLRQYRLQVPTATESSLWNDYLFTDHLGRPGTHVSRVSSRQYVALNSRYQGLNGFASNYRVVSNARELTGRYPITNAVMQEVQLASIPVFQFAIFYNSLLEFTWAAPLTIRGARSCQQQHLHRLQRPPEIHRQRHRHRDHQETELGRLLALAHDRFHHLRGQS